MKRKPEQYQNREIAIENDQEVFKEQGESLGLQVMEILEDPKAHQRYDDEEEEHKPL